MHVYIVKGNKLSSSNNLCPIYLKHDQQCLTHHLPAQELIILAQIPSKGENGPQQAQEQTKGMVSFLHDQHLE